MAEALPDVDPKRELVAVILAGGAGTRFWPLSTEARPKQFLTLLGDRSLLQLTYDRVAPLVGPERVLVLTGERFVPLVREQLPALPAANIVGEPARRDTAAAVALAALLVERRHGAETVSAVVTSDHLISPADAFRRALLSTVRGAKASSALYTFGIEPTRPATEYGYLEVEDALFDDDGVAHHALARFVEKPDAERAAALVSGGRHLWNSGMFVWRTSSILAELARQLPAHLELLRPAVDDDGSARFAASLARAFERLARVSIDYGVMEHAREVRCVRAGFSWSDVGGFYALAEHLPRDESGNAFRGGLRILDAHGNVSFCEDEGEQVALVGVSDMLVVRAGKRTLVVPRARAEEIKALVSSLPEEER